MVSGQPWARSPSAQDASWSASLHEARERGFVGRADEIRSFTEALTGIGAVRALFLHGPGGIGKTTLLDALARKAARAGRRVVYLDARELAPTAAAVGAAIAEARAGPPGIPDLPAALDWPPGSEGGPDVLLVDGYELLEPVDRWFRTRLLPEQPAGTVTVLSGRHPPQPGWRLDPGWARLVEVRELTELDWVDGTELLARLGVPEPRRQSLYELGRGHPLVLAMLAEAARGGAVPQQLADVPDLVAQLCRLILADIPDAAHRAGLATCAHATRMTQDLLARTIGARAEEVWAWLESRPYVRRGAIGMYVHDIVRELFEAEFAQRAPDGYAALHRVVRDYFVDRLADPDEVHPERAAAEILLLHRRGPLSAQTAVLRESGILSVVRAGPQDHDAICALVERDEGPQVAALARHWAQAQPRGLYRVRSDAGVDAFAMQIYLTEDDELARVDPVAAAVLATIARLAPLRAGERVNINRFASASAGYRDPLLLLVNGVSGILEWTRQPAAWTFIITYDPDYYGPYFAYLGLEPMLRVREQRHTVVGFGWDRRRFPMTALSELMARRELSGEMGPPPAELVRPAPLSRPVFAAAVREALPLLHRSTRLADSPLTGTALLGPGASDPGAALAAALLAGIGRLAGESRDAEHRRVLERTYLKGAPSQEAAAELLGLPFSTYRRHLAQALDRLVELLWAVEIGGSPPLQPGGSPRPESEGVATADR